MSRDMPRAFLDDVLANPDDDTPRLVYADWLQEHGDDERAELIRVQIERARLPEWDARQVRLRLREWRLVKKNETKWFSELPAIKGVRWEGFRRGFVGVAHFQGYLTMRKRWSEVWAAAPIEAVSMHWPRPREVTEWQGPIAGLRELSFVGRPVGSVPPFVAEMPLLSTVRVLHFGGYAGPRDILRHLAASPHLKELQSFWLPGSSVGNGGLRALIEADMPSLQELRLSAMGHYDSYFDDPLIQASGVEALAAWPGLARLRSLELSGNDVGRAGLSALMRSPHAAGLKALRLHNCRLDGEAAQEFSGAVEGLRLEVLGLGNNVLGELGATGLAYAPCLRELKSLVLLRCELPLPAARQLTRADFLDGLRVLDLNDNDFGPAGLAALLDRAPPALHTLQLRNNDIFDNGAVRLASAPASDTLLVLDLSHNGLSNQAAQALGETQHLKELLVLRLKDNKFGTAGAAALAASPLGRRLALLVLREEDELRHTELDELDEAPF